MNTPQRATASVVDDTAMADSLSRRDSLKIVAAALAVPFASALPVEAGGQAVAATQVQPNSRSTTMSTITVGKENSTSYDVTGGTLVSERVLEDNWNVAAGASATGTLACVDAWIEDFRKDIPHNDVPTLILHGDADRILPPDATARRQAKMIKDVKFVELPGGPHGVLWTHADRVNTELLSFLA